MNIEQRQFLSIDQLAGNYLQGTRKVPKTSEEGHVSFEQVLKDKSSQIAQGSVLKFSKHASGRLTSRNIELNENQISRLTDGMQKANEKGIKDSLVLVDQLAFIVNVPSKTVVTAMNSEETADKVFTNIDGAVIV